MKRKRQYERGCTNPAPFPYWTDLEGEQRDTCPRRFIFRNPGHYNALIASYNAYKSGFLPAVGGLDDQPAMFILLMSIIDATIAECEDVKRNKGRSAPPVPPSSVSVLGQKHGGSR